MATPTPTTGHSARERSRLAQTQAGPVAKVIVISRAADPNQERPALRALVMRRAWTLFRLDREAGFGAALAQAWSEARTQAGPGFTTGVELPPEPVDRAALRRVLANRIEADIAVLDALDGDADFEPDADLEDGADDEPSLGAPKGFLPEFQIRTVNARTTRRLPDEPFAVGAADDREHDDADGPEGDDEREPDVDGEPSLCGITVNALFIDPHGYTDGEISLGSLGGTARGCEGSQLRWSEGDQTDKEQDIGCRTHGRPREDRYNPSEPVRRARDEVRRRVNARERARYGIANVHLIGIR